MFEYETRFTNFLETPGILKRMANQGWKLHSLTHTPDRDDDVGPGEVPDFGKVFLIFERHHAQ